MNLNYVRQIISDIDNITCVMGNFCKTTEQTHEIQCLNTLINCLNDKTEQLYKEIYD